MTRLHKKVLKLTLCALGLISIGSLKMHMLQVNFNEDIGALGFVGHYEQEFPSNFTKIPEMELIRVNREIIEVNLNQKTHSNETKGRTLSKHVETVANFDETLLLQDAYRWRRSHVRDLNETLDQETLLYGHVEANRRLRSNRGLNFKKVRNGNVYVPYRDIIVANGVFDNAWKRQGSTPQVMKYNVTGKNRLVHLRLSEHAQRLPDHIVNYSRTDLPEALSYLEPEIFRIIPTRDHFFPGRKNPCYEKVDKKFSTRSIQCLPYVYLGGAPKSATTDVWNRLREHPDVMKRTTVRKEPHFWTRGMMMHTETSINAYLGILAVVPKNLKGKFAWWKTHVIGVDASADLLFDNLRVAHYLGNPPRGPPIVLADVIRAAHPDAKFIFILRNPTERLYSEFLYLDLIWETAGDKTPEGFHQRVSNVIRLFHKCLYDNTLRHCVARSYAPRINIGMYSVHLREWFHRYPRDQILILKTEKWAINMKHEFERICRFLDLSDIDDTKMSEIMDLERSNIRSSEDRNLGDMLPETRRLLDEFFEPFNKDLVKLLGDRSFLWTDGPTVL